MKRKTMVLLILVASSLAAFAQTSSTPAAEIPYIEVTGTAEMEAIPNEIYIGITIRERYMNKEKLTIEQQEEKLKAAIKGLGIELTNLSLSDANADFLKIRWQKKDVLTKKEYVLKVANAETVGKVFTELEKLDILDGYIDKVNHTKMDSLKKEVKIAAIKTAKNKADYLLTAIGEQAGKPLIVREVETTPYPAQAVANVRGVYRLSPGLDGTYVGKDEEDAIQFQKIKIKTTIYVKFLIK